MPASVVDILAVSAFLVLLAVAFLHPPARVEAAVGAGAAAVVLGFGAIGADQAWSELRHLLPVVAFLAAILVVAEACAAEGLFTAIGAGVARWSRHRAQRMLLVTFAVAALTTAALSLDATVVLLTPVVAAAAATAGLRDRPLVHACARLANSASLLLPVSNLTNLLAMPSLHLSFLRFAAVMAPVWLVVIAVEYVGHRLVFRADLREPSSAGAGAGTDDTGPPHLPRFPLAVLGAMLVGFAVGSPFGVEPAWIAGAAAVVLAGHAVRRGTLTPRQVAASTHLSFAVFVLCLGVVVAALGDTVLGDLLPRLVPDGDSLPQLLGVALLATVLVNLVNNLPATLLLIPLVAPLGPLAAMAALVGINVGSNLTYLGSLANLLWRRTLIRHGEPPSTATFHRVALALTPPAVLAGTVTLWAWAGVVGL